MNVACAKVCIYINLFFYCMERGYLSLATIQSTHHHEMNTVADAILPWSVYSLWILFGCCGKKSVTFSIPVCVRACVCVCMNVCVVFVWRCGRIDSAYTQYNKLMRIQAVSYAHIHTSHTNEIVRWISHLERTECVSEMMIKCIRNRFRSNDTQRHL